jgi:hypothetical protein
VFSNTPIFLTPHFWVHSSFTLCYNFCHLFILTCSKNIRSQFSSLLWTCFSYVHLLSERMLLCSLLFWQEHWTSVNHGLFLCCLCWSIMNFPFIFAKNRWPRAGRVIQVVEHMPSKYEALSSNPSKVKKKKKKKNGWPRTAFLSFASLELLWFRYYMIRNVALVLSKTCSHAPSHFLHSLVPFVLFLLNFDLTPSTCSSVQ